MFYKVTYYTRSNEKKIDIYSANDMDLIMGNEHFNIIGMATVSRDEFIQFYS